MSEDLTKIKEEIALIHKKVDELSTIQSKVSEVEKKIENNKQLSDTTNELKNKLESIEKLIPKPTDGSKKFTVNSKEFGRNRFIPKKIGA
jgi:predicted nuclease with TOPRIM domain